MYKSELKEISKLKQKKYRQILGKFIVEGKRLVLEGLNSRIVCNNIILSNLFAEKEKEFVAFLNDNKLKFSTVTQKEFDIISSTKNPQGVAAVFEIPSKKELDFNDELVICLENISDPGNVGTILRTCDWFGVNTVFLSNDCADVYNPKVLRASMGAVFNLTICDNINLVETFTLLKSKLYKIYIADMHGADYRELKMKDKIVITFCNEAFGPSEKIKQISHESITIPRKGKIESLNVSAAAAVIISHLC